MGWPVIGQHRAMALANYNQWARSKLSLKLYKSDLIVYHNRMILAFNAIIVSTIAHIKGENQRGVVLVLVVIMDNREQSELHHLLNNTITYT